MAERRSAVISPTLDEFSAVIRELYIHFRRKFEESQTHKKSGYLPGPTWDGGKSRYSSTKVNKPIWPRVAVQLARIEADPLTWMQAIFEAAQPHYPPMPNHLIGVRAIACYKKYVAENWCDEVMQSNFMSQVSSVSIKVSEYLLCRPELTDEQIRGRVLTDPGVTISPLFRFCCAIEYGMPKIADAYRQDAICEYLRFPQYFDRIWGDFIPAELQQIAVRHQKALQRMVVTDAGTAARETSVTEIE